MHKLLLFHFVYAPDRLARSRSPGSPARARSVRPVPLRFRPSVPLRSPARDRLVRPVDDHPLVVIRPSRGGHRRGPGLVETYRLHVPHFVPHFSYMYPMYPKWGTSGVQKVAPPNEGGCEIRMGLWLSLTINIFILLLSSFPCPGGSSPLAALPCPLQKILQVHYLALSPSLS